MRWSVQILGGVLALGWAAVGGEFFRGARRARLIEDITPFEPDEAPPHNVAPALSVVFAACNEERKMPRALQSLQAQVYPGPLQIVAVNDRSTDQTGAILKAFAQDTDTGRAAITALHIDKLPSGWLGKNHALWQGAQAAQGEWILFTDADIVFAPNALSRAVAYAEREGLDHLAVFMHIELHGFWETVFGLGFATLFHLRFRPWHVRNPHRREYVGIGGFNMVRRATYDAIDTHRQIALEVADDMELGHRIKQAGFRSDVLGARRDISVRWQEGGLWGHIRGMEKNAYAGLHYSVLEAVASCALLVLTVVWPFVGLFVARDRATRAAYLLMVAIITTITGYEAQSAGISRRYAPTLPLGSLLIIATVFRSLWLTEQQGGIWWRGTFYPLALLRQAPIPPLPVPVN